MPQARGGGLLALRDSRRGQNGDLRLRGEGARDGSYLCQMVPIGPGIKMTSRCPEDGSTHGSKMAQDGPNMVQDSFRMAQDGPKLAQDSPKMAPDSPEMAPRWPRMAPRWPEACPRWPQDGPRWPQEVPRLAQDKPKMNPKTIKNRLENQYSRCYCVC